jgi:signal transduction histidine kinase
MSKKEDGNLRLLKPPQRGSGRRDDSVLGDEGYERKNEETGADYNLRILQPPALFLEEEFGTATLEEVMDEAGLSREELDGKSNWAAHEQIERFLLGLRRHVKDEQEFKQACCYKLRESYGAARFVLRAVSPQLVYERAAKDFGMISKVARTEVISSGRNFHSGRYTTQRPESRLMCLSRQAQIAALPTLWGLPPATLTEDSCVGLGDDECVYHLRWYAHRRWLPLAAGILLGIAAAFGLNNLGIDAIPLWVTLPILGGLAGYAFELRRTNKANLKIGDEINDALRELARDDAESRREVLEFHRREREWGQRMEAAVAERTATLEDVLEQVKRMHEEKRSVLRGFSHDLTNPFQMVYSQASILRHMRDQLTPELQTLVDEQNEAVERMKLMLKELVDAASTDAGLIRVSPERMDVGPLVDVLRRRAQAFVHGRDIRVSVFSTREAPSSIVTDRLVFDRVVDNLLTNAAKYTERGSILVELDGKPGFLTLKVSDTGCGIDDEDIDRIFRPKGSDPRRRGAGSHGVGLSVVVQLMAQIGGKLEVKSMAGKGTTFWAHFPEVIEEPEKAEGRTTSRPRLSEDELIGQVVNIRKSRLP